MSGHSDCLDGTIEPGFEYCPRSQPLRDTDRVCKGENLFPFWLSKKEAVFPHDQHARCWVYYPPFPQQKEKNHLRERRPGLPRFFSSRP